MGFLLFEAILCLWLLITFKDDKNSSLLHSAHRQVHPDPVTRCHSTLQQCPPEPSAVHENKASEPK